MINLNTWTCLYAQNKRKNHFFLKLNIDENYGQTSLVELVHNNLVREMEHIIFPSG